MSFSEQLFLKLTLDIFKKIMHLSMISQILTDKF